MTGAAEGSERLTAPASADIRLPIRRVNLPSLSACFNRPPPGSSDQARQLHCKTDWSYFIWFKQPQAESDIDAKSFRLHDALKVVDRIHLCPGNQRNLAAPPAIKIQTAIGGGGDGSHLSWRKPRNAIKQALRQKTAEWKKKKWAQNEGTYAAAQCSTEQ